MKAKGVFTILALLALTVFLIVGPKNLQNPAEFSRENALPDGAIAVGILAGLLGIVCTIPRERKAAAAVEQVFNEIDGSGAKKKRGGTVLLILVCLVAFFGCFAVAAFSGGG